MSHSGFYSRLSFLLSRFPHRYYFYHRFLHEFHIGWTAHSVHHSGEDYNLATALRQGLFQPLFSPPFYAWMALLGLSPNAYLAHAQLNTLYMYAIHTVRTISYHRRTYILPTLYWNIENMTFLENNIYCSNISVTLSPYRRN